MTKCGFAFVFIISALAFATACTPQDGHHSHNDQRPEVAETTTVTPSGQVVTVKAEDPRAKRDLEIRQHLFDFLTLLKPLIQAEYQKVIYKDGEPLELFVGHRCHNLIEKLAQSPKGLSNLYDKLEADSILILHKDLATAACESPYNQLIVVPGKVISRSYSEQNIINPDVAESFEVTLRADDTVAAYRLSEGPFKDLHFAAAIVQDDAVVQKYSENDLHEVFSILDQHFEKVIVTALDESYVFESSDNNEGTHKNLHLKTFETSSDVTAEEFVPYTTYRGRETSCEIELKDKGDTGPTRKVNSHQQCFPEYKF